MEDKSYSMTNMSTNTNMSTITNTKTPPPASNCPFYRSPTLYPFHIFTKVTENISNLKFLEDFGGGDCTHHRGGKMHDKAGENTMFWSLKHFCPFTMTLTMKFTAISHRGKIVTWSVELYQSVTTSSLVSQGESPPPTLAPDLMDAPPSPSS